MLTVEDPVEYHLPGIGQTQVNAKVDMTFARGLRAILRQDPDVVMIGEIRDRETAEIAVQASLTGHLVLLDPAHQRRGVGAITRLVDMGVEPFLLSSSMLGVLRPAPGAGALPGVQGALPRRRGRVRAARRRSRRAADPDRARGCGECHQPGYRGRTGIYELVVFDDDMRRLVHHGPAEQEISRHARTTAPSMRDDGRRKMLEGVTTVEEILRVTRDE
ncbi:GspE/PulE family protein [Acinetobacter baumannii]